MHMCPYSSPEKPAPLSPSPHPTSSPPLLDSAMAGRQNSRNENRYHPHGQPNNFLVHSVALSPSTMSTVLRVQQRHRTLNPAITYSLHDNTSIGYEWLLPGWIAEQRTMPSGRVYRYYYDPSGHLYRTKNEVLLAWEEAGIVVLDP